MGRGVELAIYGHRPHRDGSRFVSTHARKLSHHPTGPSRRDFLFVWLDRRDETVPVVRRQLRSLQSHLSRAGIDYHSLNLDVSHLLLFASWRQIERDPSTRTRAREDNASAHSGNAAGLTPKVFASESVRG